MKCKNCKYKKDIANTADTGKAVCAYQSSWLAVSIEDDCHYIPEKTELTCEDCGRLGEDMACIACSPEDSAKHNGKLCVGFIDKRETELTEILSFWKANGLYDRNKIHKLLDEFEEYYKRLTGEN